MFGVDGRRDGGEVDLKHLRHHDHSDDREAGHFAMVTRLNGKVLGMDDGEEVRILRGD